MLQLPFANYGQVNKNASAGDEIENTKRGLVVLSILSLVSYIVNRSREPEQSLKMHCNHRRPALSYFGIRNSV